MFLHLFAWWVGLTQFRAPMYLWPLSATPLPIYRPSHGCRPRPQHRRLQPRQFHHFAAF